MGHAERDEFCQYVASRNTLLLRTAYGLTGDHADAEDLLQTALTKTYLAWRRIENKAAVDGYVRRAMVNTKISWWRRRGIDTYATDPLPEPAGGDPTGDSDLHSVVWAALRRLPGRQRSALVLRYYEGLTEREIARVLGISVGTVKSSISRAIAKLRTDADLVDGYADDGPTVSCRPRAGERARLDARGCLSSACQLACVLLCRAVPRPVACPDRGGFA